MPSLDLLSDYCPTSREDWREWLREHHVTAPGTWLVYWKVHTLRPTVSYAAAVEEALCWGWIDSRLQPIDSERYRQAYTPRKPRSVWSRVNKARVAALLATGRMTPAGLVMVERAKADGSWEALDAVEAGEVPPDLQAALAACAPAAAAWAGFTRGSRKNILYWLNTARRPETRARRVEEIIAAAAEGKPLRG